MSTLLVTGSRQYHNWDHIEREILAEHVREPITLLVHGCADGVDVIAGAIARKHGIPEDYQIVTMSMLIKYGARAPLYRNQLLIHRFNPKRCLAFPGETGGTWDTMRRCEKARIPVRRCELEWPSE